MSSSFSILILTTILNLIQGISIKEKLNLILRPLAEKEKNISIICESPIGKRRESEGDAISKIQNDKKPIKQKLLKIHKCNCKKINCVKLYCECFANGEICDERCSCINC